MKTIAHALQSVAVTLWVGGLRVTGFIFVPLLFSRLGNLAESVLRERFDTRHGIASGLFVIQSVPGLALVVLAGKAR